MVRVALSAGLGTAPLCGGPANCARFQRVPPTLYPHKNKSDDLLVEGRVELILWFWPAAGTRAADAEKTFAYGQLVFSGRQQCSISRRCRVGGDSDGTQAEAGAD